MTSLYGHDAQIAEFLAAAAGERMHHGWILAGPRGIGKGAFARAAALRLLAGDSLPPDQFAVPEDHSVAHLFAAGSHPDHLLLERLEKDNGDLARNIAVDQVRGLQRLLGNAPSLSARRTVVVDAADDLERGAANALLKSLEEPPAGTVFLLVTHSPSRLLPTIRSRCRVLRFRALDDDVMQRVAQDLLPDVTPPARDALLAMAEGSPGRMLALAQAGLAELESDLQGLARVGDPENRTRLAIARSLSPKAARPKYEAFLERVPRLIAAHAREREGRRLQDALTAWEHARDLASAAPVLSLDPATVAFEMCGLVAGLAERSP